jgi:hypothetical protein
MDLRDSLHEILLRSDTLADLFYLVFLDKYPEVQRHFHGVDMKRQNLLLTMALLVVERHAHHRYPSTEAYLHLLGRQHQWRGVPRELFAKWRDAMLETSERFHGPDWSDGLAQQWRGALDSAIESMLIAYP